MIHFYNKENENDFAGSVNLLFGPTVFYYICPKKKSLANILKIHVSESWELWPLSLLLWVFKSCLLSSWVWYRTDYMYPMTLDINSVWVLVISDFQHVPRPLQSLQRVSTVPQRPSLWTRVWFCLLWTPVWTMRSRPHTVLSWRPWMLAKLHPPLAQSLLRLDILIVWQSFPKQVNTSNIKLILECKF